MATATVNYAGTGTTITMDLANLASSGSFVSGRESNEIDNTTNKFVDVLVSGPIYVGTTPTANTSIQVYVWGSHVSLATTPIDALDGVDSAEALSNAGTLSSLRLLATINVAASTSDLAYWVLPTAVASRFGGTMPRFWGLYVAHNTNVNLRNNAVNTNALSYVGIKYDIA